MLKGPHIILHGLLAVGSAAPTLAHADDLGAVGWRFELDYLGRTEAHRPIDVVAVNARHVWQGPLGLDAALGIGALHGSGERRDPGAPVLPSDAAGFLAGAAVRFAPVVIGPVKPFVQGSVDFLYTFGRPFPAGGSSVNGLVRWGAGLEAAVSERMSLSAGYRAAHISNGGGLVPSNPAWNGRGGFIDLTWRPGAKKRPAV